MKTKLFIVLLLALPIIITGVGYAQSMNKLYIPTVESGSIAPLPAARFPPARACLPSGSPRRGKRITTGAP